MNSVEERQHAQGLLNEANRARSSGDRVSAEQGFRAAMAAFTLLEDSCATAQALASLADLHLAEGNYTAASELARQALERRPDDVQTLIGLGYAQWLNGSPADGEVTFARALRLNRRAARALAGRGQVRAELGSPHDALTDLNLALEIGLTPDDETDVRSARALALAGIGELDEAGTEIAIALERAPDRPRSTLRAARIAHRAGRHDQAREQYRQIAELTDPRDAAEARTARRLLARM